MPDQTTSQIACLTTPVFNTIRAFAQLDSQTKRLVLLRQMQAALAIDDLPMSDSEISATITYLNHLILDASFNPEMLIKKQFSGILLDKRLSGLERTMAMIFDPATEEFEIIIFTGRKFFNPVSFVTSKHIDAAASQIVSKNESVVVKKTVSLRFVNNKFVAGVKHCSKQRLASFSLPAEAEKNLIDHSNKKLSAASSMVEILSILQDLQEKIPTIEVDLIAKFVKASASSLNVAASESFIRPYIKRTNDGQYHIKLYSFANQEDLASLEQLAPQLIKQSAFENAIDNLASKVQLMHSNGTIHYNLTPKTIMLDRNSQVSFSSYEQAINVDQTKDSTIKLLSILGYVNTGNGYIEENLLDPITLQQALILVESLTATKQKSINQKGNVLPNLAELNADLNALVKGLTVSKFNFFASGNACPELCYATKDASRSLGQQIVSMLSRDARLELSTNPSYKHDVWSFGMAIVNSIDTNVKSVFFAKAIALIQFNPALKAMLHPDPDQRVTIDEFIELRKQYPVIEIPERQQRSALHAAYLNSIYTYNDKLQSMANLRKVLKFIVDSMRYAKLHDKPNILAAYHEKVVNCITQSAEFSPQQKARLFLPLITVLLDESALINIPEIIMPLQNYVHTLLTITLDGLTVFELESALHKAIVGNIDWSTVKMLLDKLKTFSAWQNYSLWHNDVTIWESCLVDDVLSSDFKRLRMVSYANELQIDADELFKIIITSTNENLARCVLSLITWKFSVDTQAGCQSFFDFLAKNPNYCRKVNDITDKIMDFNIFRNEIFWSISSSPESKVNSIAEIANACLNAVKCAYKAGNVHYIILLMREFEPFWAQNKIAQDWMLKIALKCLHSRADMNVLQEFLQQLPEVYAFQSQIIATIEAKKSKSRANSLDEEEEFKIRPTLSRSNIKSKVGCSV